MDIKFYGKIHFDRSRSDNELNMHCHLIVSRKDQANKKKLSPLTNHKNTKNGIIKGGFDRVNLFQKVEQGFDRIFKYSRQQTESFDYQNTMKNRSIIEQLKVQKKNIQSNKRKNRNRVLDIDIILPPNNKKIFSAYLSFGGKNERILSISPILSKASYLANHEEQPPKSEKKKRKVKRKKFQ